MYQIGDKLFHLSYGVCDIIDIQERKFSDVTKNYYFLRPIEDHSNSIIYIPVETAYKQTRTIYSQEEIDEMIAGSQKETVEWSDNNNFRKATFTGILKSGDTSKIIAMICCIYKHKANLEEKGRKIPVSDERILAEAQRKIHQEFAYSLHISEEEVPKYILNRI